MSVNVQHRLIFWCVSMDFKSSIQTSRSLKIYLRQLCVIKERKLKFHCIGCTEANSYSASAQNCSFCSIERLQIRFRLLLFVFKGRILRYSHAPQHFIRIILRFIAINLYNEDTGRAKNLDRSCWLYGKWINKAHLDLIFGGRNDLLTFA